MILRYIDATQYRTQLGTSFQDDYDWAWNIKKNDGYGPMAQKWIRDIKGQYPSCDVRRVVPIVPERDKLIALDQRGGKMMISEHTFPDNWMKAWNRMGLCSQYRYYERDTVHRDRAGRLTKLLAGMGLRSIRVASAPSWTSVGGCTSMIS